MFQTLDYIKPRCMCVHIEENEEAQQSVNQEENHNQKEGVNHIILDFQTAAHSHLGAHSDADSRALNFYSGLYTL